jgi:ABC-type transporter Mla subunit MlaD
MELFMQMGRELMISTIIHLIAYSLLVITLIRVLLTLGQKQGEVNQLLYYNEEIINRFNEVFDELVKTNEELQLTKSTRDLFKEDRDALIQNIRGLIPNNNID